MDLYQRIAEETGATRNQVKVLATPITNSKHGLPLKEVKTKIRDVVALAMKSGLIHTLGLK